MSRILRSSLRGLLVAIAIGLVCSGAAAAAGQKVLFDASHAQTAGNADWVIGGGFSEFGQALRNAGFTVEEHASGPIKAEELVQYAAVVLPEPNTAYTERERSALVRYVQAGGGIFAIADHNNSDRNNDGIDSVGIFNQFLPELGIRCDKTSLSQAPLSGAYNAHPVTAGVTRVGSWAACSLLLTQPSAKSLVEYGGTLKSRIFVACNQLSGGGRVVAAGDSSPFDDGTGAPGDRLHDGWHAAGYQHAQLAVNAVLWLAHRDGKASARVLRANPRAAGQVRSYAVMNGR